MKNEIFEYGNFDLVYETVDALTIEALNKGVVCYDVTFEETINGEKVLSNGKAFSINGVDFFGFTHDEPVDFSKGRDTNYSKEKVFAGSHIADKGFSVVVLPSDKLYMQSNMQDFELNGVYKAENQSFIGKFMDKPVKVAIKQSGEESSEQVLIDYFDMLAIITKNHPNKALLMIEKIISQTENVEAINSAYENGKNKPAPSGLSGDGNFGKD